MLLQWVPVRTPHSSPHFIPPHFAPLTNFLPECTPKAIIHRIAKLKNIANATPGSNGVSTATSGPAARGSSTRGRGRGSGRGGVGSAAGTPRKNGKVSGSKRVVDEFLDEDDDETEQKAKKVKKVKADPEDEGHGDEDAPSQSVGEGDGEEEVLA